MTADHERWHVTGDARFTENRICGNIFLFTHSASTYSLNKNAENVYYKFGAMFFHQEW